MAGKADSVSSVSASACHIGGPIYVNPGELALVYGSKAPFFLQTSVDWGLKSVVVTSALLSVEQELH